MFTCANTRHRGEHQHSLAIEARVCYGLIPATTPAPVPVSWPTAPALPTLPSWQKRVTLPGGFTAVFGDRHHPDGPLSEPQYRYITDLKGDLPYALTLTYAKASEYIKELNRRGRMTTPTPAPRSQEPDPKLAFLADLLPFVKKGYYAVQEYEGGAVTFLRLSFPIKGQYRGCTQVQTCHGTYGGPVKLKDGVTIWPTKRWTQHQNGLMEKLLLLCADPAGAAIRYAEKLGRCLRCNAALTDPRSRHYKIGPECEEYRPDIIEETHLKWDGKSYERLVREGVLVGS